MKSVKPVTPSIKIDDVQMYLSTQRMARTVVEGMKIASFIEATRMLVHSKNRK